MVRLGRWPVPVASRVLNQEISTLWRFSVLGHERRNLLSISACKDRLQMIRCLPCELEISLPQYGLKQASLKLRRHVFRPASEAGRGRPSGPALPRPDRQIVIGANQEFEIGLHFPEFKVPQRRVRLNPVQIRGTAAGKCDDGINPNLIPGDTH